MHTFYLIVILITIFGFPLIAVINYRQEMTSNIFSLLYRVVAVIFPLFSLYQMRKDKRWPIITPITSALFIFWGYYLVKLIIDLYWFQLTPKMDFQQFSPSYYLFFATLLCLFPMIAFLIIGQKINMEILTGWLFKYMVLINIIYFLVFTEYGIYELIIFTGRLSLSSQSTGEEYLNAITIGQYAGFYFILLYYQNKIRLLHLVLGIPPLILLVFTSSKGPIFSLLATIFLIQLFRFKIGSKKMLAVVISLLVGIFTMWYFNVSVEDLLIYNRIIAGFSDESSVIRLEIFDALKEQLASNIFLGTHYYVVKMNAYSHNLILDVLLSTGLLGFFFFFKAIWGIGKSFVIEKFENPLSALILFRFLMAMSSGYVFALTDFWALIGLYLGIKFSKNNYSFKNV